MKLLVAISKMALSISLICASLQAHAATVNALTLWTRASGAYSDNQNPNKKNPLTVDIESMKHEYRSTYDAQYGKNMNYSGVTLDDVIKLYSPQPHDDLMILHFDNGMTVPMDLRSGKKAAPSAFIAVEVCSSRKACSKDFTEISKENAFAVNDDPRPISFTWNKFVVTNLSHPDVPEARKSIFSPWHHVDTLNGIEFVNRKAYYQQFALGENEGQKVFQERCQFCHGVRYVGAKFGWDFVTPLPLFEKRPPDQLLNHVKYPKVRATSMGLMMPAQTDVTVEEMKMLWQWMRKAASHPLPAYTP